MLGRSCDLTCVGTRFAEGSPCAATSPCPCLYSYLPFIFLYFIIVSKIEYLVLQTAIFPTRSLPLDIFLSSGLQHGDLLLECNDVCEKKGLAINVYCHFIEVHSLYFRCKKWKIRSEYLFLKVTQHIRGYFRNFNFFVLLFSTAVPACHHAHFFTLTPTSQLSEIFTTLFVMNTKNT